MIQKAITKETTQDELEQMKNAMSTATKERVEQIYTLAAQELRRRQVEENRI